MQTVGFIGLGKMGGPVATRIQESGFPMVVFDLDEAATRPFLERGARLASSAAEVASLADVTFTAVPMPKDVEAVAIGREGIVEGNSGRRGLRGYLHQQPPALQKAGAALSAEERMAHGRPGRSRTTRLRTWRA